MSNLQWLGIWGMTGFSKPEKSDLDKWSKGITYVLSDPKGRHYFKEFLTNEDRGFKDEAKVLEIWTNCEMFISQGANNPEVILEEAREHLSMTYGDLPRVEDVRTGSGAQVRQEILKIQEGARDDLISVHSAFIDFLKTNLPKKARCFIL
ncbi:uncharacterized protein [Periplaneta americana]|uniref:uncharacterized protein isoform X1 n=1 Tax=Periplaneta americana TaxID=6978 RepID=UPI0037E7AEF1